MTESATSPAMNVAAEKGFGREPEHECAIGKSGRRQQLDDEITGAIARAAKPAAAAKRDIGKDWNIVAQLQMMPATWAMRGRPGQAGNIGRYGDAAIACVNQARDAMDDDVEEASGNRSKTGTKKG